MGDFFRSKLPGSNPRHAYTFEELLIEMRYCEVEPEEIDLSTKIGSYVFPLPFVSSPMDTVTEAEMAIWMARIGGWGVMHRLCPIKYELEQLKQVKRAESYIIRDVKRVPTDMLACEAFDIMKTSKINGLLVMDGDNLAGILTNRDIRFAETLKLPVTEYMTKEVITVRESDIMVNGGGIDTSYVKKMMHTHRIEKLPVVDAKGSITGLVTAKDIERREKYKMPVADNEGRLIVGAALSPFDLERARALNPYADIFVIDVSHFWGASVMDSTYNMMKDPLITKPFVLGSLGSYNDAEACISKFYDTGKLVGFRVGVGSGSICTTSDVTKAGSPTPYATAQVADAVHDHKLSGKIAVISDGGIANGGYAAVCLSLGADEVMFGGAVSGCDESPGIVQSLEGRKVKYYRGMGSAGARQKQKEQGEQFKNDRYTGKKLVEGVETYVPYTGSLEGVLSEIEEQLRAALGHAGAKSIYHAHEAARILEINPSAGVGVPKAHRL